MAETPYSQTDRELKRRIERSAGGRAGYKQLVRELGLGGGRERRLLLEQLARMTARGELVKVEAEMWALPAAVPEKTARVKRDEVGSLPGERRAGRIVGEGGSRAERDRMVAGKLDLHRDGYGFVRPNGSSDRADDLFIPPSELNGAMQGDEVLVDEAPPGRDGRRSGRVARVLTRRNPTVVGIFHYARTGRRGLGSGRTAPEEAGFDSRMFGGNYVTPLDERMTQPILIPEGMEEAATVGETPHRVIGEEARVWRRRRAVGRGKVVEAGAFAGVGGEAGSKAGAEAGLSTALSPQRASSSGAPVRSGRDDRFVVGGESGSWAASEDEAGVGMGGNDEVGEDEYESLEGMAVDVEITEFPQPGRPAQGRVIEVLGPPDGFGVDVEIIIRKHHLPHVFPANVLAEAAASAEQTVERMEARVEEQIPSLRFGMTSQKEGEVGADGTDGADGIHGAAGADGVAGADGAMDREAAVFGRRRDFRGLPIVTIDGETARDFDDAVMVREMANGNWELQVHIADVSHYVRPGTALDLEARLRGTSVYFPDRAIPMLPPSLSSGMCSLRPDEDRLVLSCVMEIDGRGEVVAYEVGEGVIRSARRMTYTQVQAVLDGDEAVAKEVGELAGEFGRMVELALKLNAKRKRRGSIDFDLPEPVVQFDPEGNMASIVRSERGWAHRLIEEFMLSANECVATWIETQGVASIYRIHEVPDPKRIVDFEETAAGFGYSLGIGNLPVKKLTMKSDRRDVRKGFRGAGRDGGAKVHEVPERIPVTPQMYQKLTAKIAGRPEERVLAYLMLRSLKQARYAEKNEGHFALASPSYTHFTSPIRRYPDLMVHRLLRALLEAGADPMGGGIYSTDAQPWGSGVMERRPGREEVEGPVPREELEAIATESSQTERRADDAERELMEWKKIKFMQDRVGEEFDAIVLSCTKYGFFVELEDLFIEGLVPIASLGAFGAKSYREEERYVFRDTDRSIVGMRSGRVFKIGKRVRVLLDRIDRQQRRLQFALMGVPGEAVEAGSASGSGAPRKKKVRAMAAAADGVAKSPERSGKPKKGKKLRLRDRKSKGKRR